jgi:hypothetical protein
VTSGCGEAAMLWLRDVGKALLIFLVIVGLLNLLSYWFDWPVWFYFPR